jgi:hypothetical protein
VFNKLLHSIGTSEENANVFNIDICCDVQCACMSIYNSHRFINAAEKDDIVGTAVNVSCKKAEKRS